MKEKKSNPDKHSERSSKKHSSKKDTDKDHEKRQPNPDDQNEETGPPIKEMPKANNPHQEEILN